MRKLKLTELNRLDTDGYKTAEKLPITIILDNIRSAHNVGSIFRTTDGFAFQKIILCGITATPPHKEINKTAIGATASVDWSYEKDIISTLVTLRSKGTTILGIEQTTSSVSLMEYAIPKERPLAIVFGNEVNGLSDSVLPLLDIAIEIPQFGTKHSFNVAVCAGMTMWEISRQLRTD